MDEVRRAEASVVGIHDGGVGEDCAFTLHDAVAGMCVTEQMSLQSESLQSFEQFFRAIIDAVVEVKDAVGWGMGDQDVGVVGYTGCVVALALGETVAHKHRYSVEVQPVNLDV